MEGKIEAYKAITKKIDDLKDQLRAIERKIIDDHCPYKKGDTVIYTEWWRGNKKDYYGVVHSVGFIPDSKAAIDGLWKLVVIPTTKSFRQRAAFVILGDRFEGDTIRKA
jgi:hypothetical protein